MQVNAATEFDSLVDLSARLGAEPLLVQAGTGNTSLKSDGVLWIKASGKWLAHAATEEILIPVNLGETLRRVHCNADPAGQTAMIGGRALAASVETAMHAVLPHRVVLHVHSVNTIAFAVREDGPDRLKDRLDGLPWQWIPYTPSGLPLAHLIEAAVARNPETAVLVLANHGLVVCGDSCAEAEALLREVERRVSVAPRPFLEPGWDALHRMAAYGKWRVPTTASLHSIGADPISRRIVSGGVLYPCQAIFLAPKVRVHSASTPDSELGGADAPYVLIKDAGILLGHKPNPTELATLNGLVQVLQRIPAGATVHYLAEGEVRDLLCADVYHYRELVEDNGAGHIAFPARSMADSANMPMGS